MGDKNRDAQDLGGVLKCPFCDATYKSRGGLHKHKTKFHPRCLPPSVTSTQIPSNPPQDTADPPEVSNSVGTTPKGAFKTGAQSISGVTDGSSDDLHSGNPGTSSANYFPHLCDCGSRFHDRDSLRKHHKICLVWTSSSSRFCERSFDSFKGRKAHEQKTHKTE